jgi:uncharacterized HhH-GPD family protein
MKADYAIDRRQRAVAERLLAYGRTSRGGATYTRHRTAERFIRDNDNAFLFGVIFDQGIPYERAWRAPYVLKQRLGHFSMRRIATSSVPALRRVLRGTTPGGALQRFTTKMAVWLRGSARLLVRDYAGDAGNVWNECSTAGEVIERLDAFPGIGPKKAHMATRILHESRAAHGFRRWSDINVAPDVHVRRVFVRAGLVTRGTYAEVLAVAARLNPRYPGALDEPAWSIGQSWCRPSRPDCDGRTHREGRPCPLRSVCPRTSHSRLTFGY